MKKLFLRPSLFSCLFFCATVAMSQTADPEYVDGKIWVKLKQSEAIPVTTGPTSQDVTAAEVPVLHRIASKYQLKSIKAPFYKSGSADISRILKVQFNDFSKTADLLQELEASGIFEYVEREPVYKLDLVPNDPVYTSSQWELPFINAPAAWNISTGNTTIVVAVTDNAMQITHPDLSPNVWVNPGEIASNSLDDDGNGYIDDVNGWDVADGDNNVLPPNTSFDHGSHTSGTVAARSNNGAGVASIGFTIKFMPVKITMNASNNAAVDDPVEGIYYAGLNRARVISCSWGTATYSATIQAIVDWAYNTRGSIIVAAAGNAGTNVQHYPAAMNNVVCVASTGSTDAKSSFSQYGTWVDICAPGEGIWSTIPTNTYGSASGTSMATPLVSGLLGLMMSVNPNLTQTQAINCLKSSAVNINSQNGSYIGMIGSGRINALAALQCVQGITIALDASLTDVTEGATCSLTPPMQVVLRNAGTSTLTSCNINYRIDNNAPSFYGWTGSLTTGSSVVVNLPTITFPSGQHNFTAWTSNPNSATDNYKLNDTTKSVMFISPTGQSLPFTEGFEGSTFVPNGWYLSNADGEISWASTTVAKYSGTKSAWVNNYDDPFIRTFDYMLTPVLNMSTATSTTLTFRIAHRPVSASVSDTMIVYGSSDCGATFNVIYKKWGATLATVSGTQTTPFVPSGTNQWRQETVTITGALATTTQAFFAFTNRGNSGNNMWLDDINISGTITTGVNETNNNMSVSVFPNPNKGSFTLTTENLPAGTYDVSFMNLVGQVVKQQSIERTMGVHSEAIELNGISSGVYLVKVSGNGGTWVSRFVVE